MQTVEHTMSQKQCLIEAKTLITPRERWGQGDFAQDVDGNDVSTLDGSAQCFCALGAWAHVARVNIDTADPTKIPHEVVALLDRAATKLWLDKKDPEDTRADCSIVELNDREVIIPDMHPHDAVLAAYDIAIEMAGPDEVGI
jgi:hypothetical protein